MEKVKLTESQKIYLLNFIDSKIKQIEDNARFDDYDTKTKNNLKSVYKKANKKTKTITLNLSDSQIIALAKMLPNIPLT